MFGPCHHRGDRRSTKIDGEGIGDRVEGIRGIGEENLPRRGSDGRIPPADLSGTERLEIDSDRTRVQKDKLLNDWKRALINARKAAVFWHNKQKALRLKKAEEENRHGLSSPSIHLLCPPQARRSEIPCSKEFWNSLGISFFILSTSKGSS